MTVYGVDVVVMSYRGSGSNGVRGRGQSINDNNMCKIVVLGCPGVGKTGEELIVILYSIVQIE